MPGKGARKSRRIAPPQKATSSPQFRAVNGKPTLRRPKGLEKWEDDEDKLETGLSSHPRKVKGDRSKRPFDSYDAYLKREIYRLVLGHIEHQTLRVIDDVLDYREIRRPPFGIRSNPFHWALSIISHLQWIDIERRHASLFGKQMMYAFHHRVPPELLVGFIYQTGPRSIRLNLKNGGFEPWISEVRRIE